MLSSIGWALSDMADAVVVGQRLGAVGLAAIGLILPVYMINCMFAHGLGLGGSVRYSRLLSQGQNAGGRGQLSRRARAGAAFSVTTAVLGSVFMTRCWRCWARGARTAHCMPPQGTICRSSSRPRRCSTCPTCSTTICATTESAPRRRRLGHRQPLRHRAEHHAGAGAGHGHAGRGTVHRAGTDHHHRHLSAGLFRSEAHAALRAAARALARSCPFRAEGGYGHLGAVPVPDDLFPRATIC